MPFNEEASGDYEHKGNAAFSSAAPVSWKENVAGAFTTVKKAKAATIRFDQPISIHINKASGDGIDVIVAESPFTIDNMVIEDLFFNTGGVATNIRVLLR